MNKLKVQNFIAFVWNLLHGFLPCFFFIILNCVEKNLFEKLTILLIKLIISLIISNSVKKKTTINLILMINSLIG